MQTCYSFAGFELLTSEWVSALSTLLIGLAATYYASAEYRLSRESKKRTEDDQGRTARAAVAGILESLRAAKGSSERLVIRLNELMAEKAISGRITAAHIRKCTAVLKCVDYGQSSVAHLAENEMAALGKLRGQIVLNCATLEVFTETLAKEEEKVINHRVIGGIETVTARISADISICEQIMMARSGNL